MRDAIGREIPWAARVWALPFLSALAPSERYSAKRGKRHKKITEWAWQLLLMLRRWYPQREIVAVADRAYASLKLLDRCRSLRDPITFITRLRLDGALYEPAPPRRPGQIGRPRLRASACLTFLWWPKTLKPFGSQPRSLTATGARIARSRSLPRVPCGTPRACSPYLFVGYWCAILKESSKPRHCCVPTSMPILRRSSAGL